MQRVFLSFAVLAMLLNMTMATNYTVGAPNGGWDQSTALQTWASSLTFLVGDALIFQYTPNHDVVEVPQADYTSCQITNPIQTYNGGNTVIPLTAPVKRFFVCGTGGHCASGMKVEIDVLAATSPSPSSPPANSPPSSPSASPVPSPSPKASSPAPAGSPDNSSPSPTSPASDSPASSPTSSPSPAGSAVPPPPPSSANKDSFKTSLAMGFGLVVMMVLTL